MITDSKKWNYLFVKRLSALLKGVTSRHDEDFYCLNCFYSFTTENVLKKYESENIIQEKKPREFHLFCMLIRSFSLKILVLAITILKNHQQSKSMNIYLLDIDYLHNGDLTLQKKA